VFSFLEGHNSVFTCIACACDVKAIDDRGHWETRGFRVTAANSLAGGGSLHLTYYRSLKAGESELQESRSSSCGVHRG
jgi:hypothetical protein